MTHEYCPEIGTHPCNEVLTLENKLAAALLQVNELREELDGYKSGAEVEARRGDELAEEVKCLNRLNQELQKVVDAAVEWWADPHDTTKTIVDLQNEVEVYWEKHKNEKRKDE